MALLLPGFRELNVNFTLHFNDIFFCLGLALHADYMANMSVLGSRMGELHHSASLLGSTDLPFSLDGKISSFSSLSSKHPFPQKYVVIHGCIRFS